MNSSRVSLISIWIFHIWCIILLFFWYSIAATNPEIDTRLLLQDRVLENKDAWDRTTLVDKIVDGRWLFEASYSFEIYSQALTHSNTIDSIFDHLTNYMEYCPWWVLYTKQDAEQNMQKEVYLHPDPRTKKPVPITLTKKDVVNVYTLSKAWLWILWTLNNERVFDFAQVSETDKAFLESCKWIVSCQEWISKLNYDWTTIKENEIPPTTAVERDQCESIVTDLFDIYSAQIGLGLEYDTNRDWEIYYNNILEEDRWQICDVNQELEKVGKLLWSTVEDLPKYSFYDPQKVSKNSSWSYSWAWDDDEVRLPSEYESEEEEVPDESSFENSIEDIPYNSVPDETITREVTWDYLWSANNWKKVVGPSWAWWWNSDRLVAKPKEWWLSSLIKTPKQANSDKIWWVWVIQNPQCEVDELWPEDKDIDLLKESWDLTDTLQKYWNDLDKDERLSQALANEKLLTKKEQETHNIQDEPVITEDELQEDLDNYLNWMAKIDEEDTLSTLEQMEGDIKSCITEFTDEDEWSRRSQLARMIMWSSELRECLRKVFCKEIVDPSWLWIYRIRFCSRMNKTVSTPTTKKVKSILDTLETVYTVLHWMTSSWRMVKHKQATEALEWQIADIKFKDMFSFTINVIKNTPRTTSDPKVEKELILQELQDIKKVTMNEYEDLSVLFPFINDATMYNESRVKAIEQDLQISTDFKWSLQEANDIIWELNRSGDYLYDHYRRMTTFEQIQHGNIIMADHIEFWRDMLSLAEELRSELEKHYNKMK